MELQLTAHEARVLGCLIEKEMTTPEYYPLSLNALTNACNQKSNRDPVISLDETDIVLALDSLRFKGLAMQGSNDGGRVPKYQHNLSQKLYLEPDELSILCELLVRGPQTVGELRTRCERMHSFPSLESVESVLQNLSERDNPIAVKLPRQPGRKESRFAHLFFEVEEYTEPTTNASPPEAARRYVDIQGARLQALEDEVQSLRAEINSLSHAFATFQDQFK